MAFESVKVSVKGKVLFPKFEEGKFQIALAIDGTQIKKLADALKMSEEDFAEKYVKQAEEKTQDGNVVAIHQVINTKSAFDFPIYDTNKEELTDYTSRDIYHGAEVVVSLLYKEYTYKKKKGITSYISGLVLIENGEPPVGGFESVMGDIDLDDLIQF